MNIYTPADNTMVTQVFDSKTGKLININYQFLTDTKEDYLNKKSWDCY